MIPISRPKVGEREAAAAAEVVRSGWLTQGPRVAAFEAAFAAAVGAPHATAVTNCTAAIELVFRALGIGAGDEVITVSHSFVATANGIRLAGAEPVFADVDPITFNMDPASAEALVGPRTRAILVVHQIGMPADLAAFRRLADRHGLLLVEDAACAIGSEIEVDGRWRRIGSPLSHAACFSFHPRKVLTTGEGGMIATADAALDARLKTMRQHGMSISDAARHAASRVTIESYPISAGNVRMTDMQAAVGLVQLESLDEIVAERRRLAARYLAILAERLPDLKRPVEPRWARSNWQSFCIGLPEGAGQVETMQAMLEAGVATRRAVMAIHLEEPYRGARHAGLAATEHVSGTHVLLPMFNGLTPGEQDRVVDALAAALRPARVREAAACP